MHFIDVLFSGFDDEEIYFDEFVRLSKEVTSELFVCVYDCIYQYIPCAKNFLIMRANYIDFLQSKEAQSRGINFLKYTYTHLMPPVTSKMVQRFLENPDNNVDETPKCHTSKL